MTGDREESFGREMATAVLSSWSKTLLFQYLFCSKCGNATRIANFKYYLVIRQILTSHLSRMVAKFT
jgi:hypothetical protein